MFKPSRRKIVAAIMGALLLLMIAILTCVYAVSYIETERENNEMLARKIKSLKIPVFLLTWHYDQQDSTAKALKEEITFQININKLLDADPGLKDTLCESIGY